MAASASSTTWSRTSTSSSTSDRRLQRLAAIVRLVHPFPSILDGVVVAVVALIAGGSPALAFQLGLSMTTLQFSIGALNDLHDAPDDAGRRPGKPIPAGLVGAPFARGVVVGGAVIGTALATLVDPRIGLLAAIVLVIGYWYDLLAKGTVWSWLPFAVGIPILPVYGWYGAALVLPSFVGILIPVAFLASGALAIANARADVERDRAAGTVSVATALGLEGSWRQHARLWAGAIVIALGWLVFRGTEPLALAPVVVAGGLMAVVVLVARTAGPGGRERAWQFEAVLAAVGLACWVLALAQGT
jgi:4-hydroxybenzoate polyprenyltransferase